MSIDRRMRDGLHRNASVLDPAVEEALRASRKRGARMRWARRGTAAGVAAMLLVGILGLASLAAARARSSRRWTGCRSPVCGKRWCSRRPMRSPARSITVSIPRAHRISLATSRRSNTRSPSMENSWIIYRADDGGALVGQEEGFWDAPDPGQIRLFAPNAPATYLFDSSISSSTLQLQPRRLASSAVIRRRASSRRGRGSSTEHRSSEWQNRRASRRATGSRLHPHPCRAPGRRRRCPSTSCSVRSTRLVLAHAPRLFWARGAIIGSRSRSTASISWSPSRGTRISRCSMGSSKAATNRAWSGWASVWSSPIHPKVS